MPDARTAVAPDRPPPRMSRGCFIAVEGPNGVGKTTSAATLYALLQARGVPAHLTTEPSDTPFGRLVRSSESGLSGRALALAVAADRYTHVENEIKPAIDAGQVAIITATRSRTSRAVAPGWVTTRSSRR